MPSVGMRRSTRVLVVKGGEGARVLRSGRRLWPDSDGGGRLGKASVHRDESSGAQNGDGVSNCKVNGWHHPGLNKQTPMTVATEPNSPKPLNIKLKEDRGTEKTWGLVYQRKRKRVSKESSNDWIIKSLEDRMYGKYYVRRQRRKTTTPVLVERSRFTLAAVLDSSRCETNWFAHLLGSVLGYLMRVRVGLRELSAFLGGGIVHEVFSSHGIHFSRVPPRSGPGICKLFGVIHFVPLFSVDFSAISSCFLHMQVSMLLRSRYLALTGTESDTEMDSQDDEDNDESLSRITSHRDLCGSKTLTSGKVGNKRKRVSRPTSRASKLATRSARGRNGLNTFSFQTKRRSTRSTRVRDFSSLPLHEANGDLVRRSSRIRTDSSPLPSLVSDRKLRSSVRKSTLPNIREVKPTLVGARENIDSTCCSANLLICESDRCFREEGANIVLELSDLKQWVLAVKRDGTLRCSHVAQNVMRPCVASRFTPAIIWTGEDGWKLEFLNQGDWFVFKELYKKCCDRNAQLPANKIIPVPGVREVSGYNDYINSASFVRPNSYIVFDDDEVARAMAKRTANYDIDSGDEEWLNKFNNDSNNELHERVSAENFELIIDAFEKAHFCSPDDYSDEKAATDLCLDLERREVVEAVYQYWVRKRKQKRSMLVRIFQCHQPRRAQLVPKPVSRRRRSFKRQASQAGRGKRRLPLQAIAAEQDALDEENAMLRVEEAKASTHRNVEFAIHKRKRAQVLTEYADLAVYKATMALRIAEAARVAESTDAAAVAFFVDEWVLARL